MVPQIQVGPPVWGAAHEVARWAPWGPKLETGCPLPAARAGLSAPPQHRAPGPRYSAVPAAGSQVFLGSRSKERRSSGRHTLLGNKTRVKAGGLQDRAGGAPRLGARGLRGAQARRGPDIAGTVLGDTRWCYGVRAKGRRSPSAHAIISSSLRGSPGPLLLRGGLRL